MGLRVAIVGAGPSGIVAVKALLAERHHVYSLIKVYERRRQTGGAWNYTPEESQTQKKPLNVPSIDPADVDPPLGVGPGSSVEGGSQIWPTPMYRELNTNIPAQLMAYHKVPFPEGTELFPTRQTVLQYLQGFASDFLSYVSFGRDVLSVEKGNGAEVWSVRTRNVVDQTEAIETFDRVIIASGHYETPKIPSIPGLKELNESYPDLVRHSKYYRSPTEYAGCKTLVIGSGPSGADIAGQISQVAQLPVLRSTRSPITTPVIDNPRICDIGEVVHFGQDRSAKLKGGEVIVDLDRILFCTGYLYSIPFLNLGSAEEQLITNGERLRNLYEQMFYFPDTTIAFLAMGMNIVPFPIAEVQACYIARVWADRLHLPSKQDMRLQERRNVALKGDTRSVMALPHPEDGFYIQRLRDQCMRADSVTQQEGLIPVDWRNSERLHLRANGKVIKQQWLLAREQQGQSGICSISASG